MVQFILYFRERFTLESFQPPQQYWISDSILREEFVDLEGVNGLKEKLVGQTDWKERRADSRGAIG
jgi:hypothetical protein